MNKPSMNLQDSFLNQARKESIEVRIMMLDGSEINGAVRGFDNFTVIVHAQNMQHLLYKHAIAQIIAKKTSRKDNQPKRQERHHDDNTPEPKPKAKEKPFNALDLSSVKSEEKPSVPKPQALDQSKSS